MITFIKKRLFLFVILISVFTQAQMQDSINLIFRNKSKNSKLHNPCFECMEKESLYCDIKGDTLLYQFSAKAVDTIFFNNGTIGYNIHKRDINPKKEISQKLFVGNIEMPFKIIKLKLLENSKIYCYYFRQSKNEKKEYILYKVEEL